MNKKNDLIDEIFIGAPCNVEWEHMDGDTTVRNCRGCNKNVYNLSELDKTEAEYLLKRKGDKICLLIERDQEGKPILRSKPKKIDPANILRGVAASILSLLVSTTSVFAKESTNKSNSKVKSNPEKKKVLTKPRKAQLKVENMKALPGEVCIPVTHVNTSKNSDSLAGTKYNLNPSWLKDKESRKITKNWSSSKATGSKGKIGSDRRAFILYRLARHHEKEGRTDIADKVYKKALELLATGKHDPKFKSTVEADFKRFRNSNSKIKPDKKKTKH